MKTRKDKLDMAFRIFIVIFTNLLYSLSIVIFIEPCKLYAGGASGFAQLIKRIFDLFTVNIDLGLLILLVNIPIFLIGVKYVSKKFALYSVIAVLIQSVSTSVFTKLFENNNPFVEMITFTTADGRIATLYGGILTLAIFGGLLSGAASGIALRYGTSTGGIDIIAQALSIHKNINIGSFTMVINVLLALIGGVFLSESITAGLILFLFSCVRMILNSVAMDKIHTAYAFTALYIFTHNKEEVSQGIINEVKRGCTFIDVQGAYTQAHFTEIYCVVSKYEVDRVMRIIERYDPKAFVTIQPVRGIKGNFKKHSIV